MNRETGAGLVGAVYDDDQSMQAAAEAAMARRRKATPAASTSARRATGRSSSRTCRTTRRSGGLHARSGGGAIGGAVGGADRSSGRRAGGAACQVGLRRRRQPIPDRPSSPCTGRWRRRRPTRRPPGSGAGRRRQRRRRRRRHGVRRRGRGPGVVRHRRWRVPPLPGRRRDGGGARLPRDGTGRAWPPDFEAAPRRFRGTGLSGRRRSGHRRRDGCSGGAVRDQAVRPAAPAGHRAGRTGAPPVAVPDRGAASGAGPARQLRRSPAPVSRRR